MNTSLQSGVPSLFDAIHPSIFQAMLMPASVQNLNGSMVPVFSGIPGFAPTLGFPLGNQAGPQCALPSAKQVPMVHPNLELAREVVSLQHRLRSKWKGPNDGANADNEGAPTKLKRSKKKDVEPKMYLTSTILNLTPSQQLFIQS